MNSCAMIVTIKINMSYETDTSLDVDLNDDLYEAIDGGDPEAQYRMGLCFHTGFEVTQSYKLSTHFFFEAAIRGHAKSMHSLGICYKYGEGVALDNTKALEYFHLAVRNGYVFSNCELGFMNFHGYGTMRNYEAAEHYLKTAIDSGYTCCMPLYEETLKKLNK